METSELRLTRWATHLLLALAVVGIFHAGWRLKRALNEQSNLGSTQAAVDAKLNHLTKNDPFNSIGDALAKVDTATAQKKIKSLENTLSKLESTLHITSEPMLTKSINKFKDAVQESASFSHPPELVSTLLDKSTSLKNLAISHRWKNLTAYSTRLETRLKGLRQNGRTDSPQVRYAESDIASMERLTRTSTLEETNKQEVLRRLEGLRQEISMLSDVHVAGQRYQSIEANGREGLARWLGRARLSAGALKTAGERRLQGAVQEIWIVGATLLLIWAGLSLLWSMALRSQRQSHDQGILEVLRDGIHSRGKKWRQYVGEARIDEVERTIKMTKKKMSLGDDLQSSLPFGSLLVSQKGRVVWANSIFCDEFHFDQESVMEEDFDWNHVRNRLTGVPADAIERALTAGEGGTWQIQAEVEQGVCLPYEMHVSPVDVASGEEKKVFVVFYSMVLMREAIADQAKLVASPMRAAIQALENGEWDMETGSRLAPLWSTAGLGADWARLSQAVHRLDGSRRDLLSQVEQLENTVHDQAKMIQELEMGIDRRLGNSKDQVHVLKQLRDGLISLDELSRDLGLGHASVIQEALNYMKRTEVIRDTMKGVSERLISAKDSVVQLERNKQDYKLEKQEIADSKLELMKIHNKFLGSLPAMSHTSENLAACMKDQLLRLDESVARLDSRLSQIDVQITKLAMACAGHVPEVEKMGLDLSSFEKSAHEIQATMREDQENVVKLLHELVEMLRHDQQELIQLREGMPETTPPTPEMLYPFV